MLKILLLGNKKILTILTALVIVSCYNQDDYNYSHTEIADKFISDVINDSIRADGASTSQIDYSFPVSSDISLTSVLLKASSGTFVESNSDSLRIEFVRLDNAEENRVKTVRLRASTSVGNSIISAHISNYEILDTVHFYKSFASKISIDSDRFYIKNDSITLISLDATLSSSTGLASSGQTVTFQAPDNLGIKNKISGNSNSKGVINLQYLFTDLSYTGELLFKATSINEEGDIIEASKIVYVVD